MLTIKKVQGKREMKKWVRFPTELYKNTPQYVPPIESDELHLTNPKYNASFDESDAEYFIAYRDGVVVGRVAGIICYPYNKKNNDSRARFSRFECIDDQEVANLLLKTVEDWARSKGMTKVHGPLGFNDLEREGLLVSGFDKQSTFLGNYNFEYYKKLIENAGYVPDAKWVEWRIYVPNEQLERVERVASIVERRYGFYEKKFKNMNEIVKGYGKEVFELLNNSFASLYGTIPLNDKLIAQTIDLFKLVLDKKYVSLIFDKDDKVCGFGVGYPSMANAITKSKGRLFPFGIFRLLHEIKHPKVVELALIGVDPKYHGMGVTSLIIKNLHDRMMENGIEYCDTGLQLETNTKGLAALDMFERELVRKKTCYIKKL